MAATGKPSSLAAWNDGAAKSQILDFVARVTEQGGAEFVPPAERIATFDNEKASLSGRSTTICMSR